MTPSPAHDFRQDWRNPGRFHERHRELLAVLRDYVVTLSGTTEYFVRKYRVLADPAAAAPYLRVFFYELRAAGIDATSKAVLDAGCGSGQCSVLFALIGADHVEAVDMFEQNIGSLRSVVERFGLPISVRKADVCSGGMSSASFDVIFCNEAISHFHDWRAFVKEAGRLLKPGGRVLISDWNNGANPLVRRQIYRFWEESECGPFRASAWRPGEKNLPYLFRRWMIIRRSAPALADDEVFHLGLRTAGIGGKELLDVCRKYLEDRTYPDASYRRGMSQSRPEDAQRNEEPVDPREIVALLKEAGVRARARAYFGLNRTRWLSVLNSLASRMGPFPLMLSPKYVVYGQRE